MVSEAIFPTNWGYICIEKWSQIFVSGIGSAHSESEEKTLDTFFFSQSMLLPLVVENCGNLDEKVTKRVRTVLIQRKGKTTFAFTIGPRNCLGDHDGL